MTASVDTLVENGRSPGSQDIGLIFVREYYTFLNKNPQKLHAFYKDDSYLVRGNEAETTETIHGQEAIRHKFDELNFEDCRVTVTQVDSQPSADGGILVQVLGYMENGDESPQKYSQTFFLAKQPNGFYVLNDVFRFLKEKNTSLEDEEELAYTAEDEEEEQVRREQDVPATVVKEDIKPAAVEVNGVEPVAAVTTTAPATAAVPAATVTTSSSTSTGAAAASAPAAASPSQVEESVVVDVEKKQESAVPEQPQQRASSPTPAAAPAPAATVATAATEPPAPTTPKTWANLAAGPDAKKASPSVSTAASPTPPADRKPVHPPKANGPPKDQPREQKPKVDETHEVFLKNVRNLTADLVKEAFSAEFGEVKSVFLHPGKATGLLGFASPESSQKALKQHTINVNNVTVIIEERRAPGKFTRHNGPHFDRKFQTNRRGGGGNQFRGKPRGGGGQHPHQQHQQQQQQQQ